MLLVGLATSVDFSEMKRESAFLTNTGTGFRMEEVFNGKNRVESFAQIAILF